MPDVRVVKQGKKFKVLVNFVQRGIDYSNEAQANKEAAKVKEQGTW